MELIRYNVFNQIHKGLRLMLFNTGTAIQQTDFTEVAEASCVIQQLEEILSYFDQHADHEDTYILPNVTIHNSILVDELEQDHGDDHALVQNLLHHISLWKYAADKETMKKAGEQLHYVFNDFIAFNLYHMNKEERILNKVLWKHYTDLEILGMEQEILNSIQSDVLIEESKWMMRAINNQEVIEWIVGVKNGAPAEVFNTFLNMARQELPEKRWQQIRSVLELQTVAS
jgi:hypothetical protein